MRDVHDTLPNDVEQFDVIVQHATTKQEIPVEPALPCVIQVRRPTTTQKNAVSKEGGWRLLALIEERSSLTKSVSILTFQ